MSESNSEISTRADGGPCSNVYAGATLHSAPHQNFDVCVSVIWYFAFELLFWQNKDQFDKIETK